MNLYLGKLTATMASKSKRRRWMQEKATMLECGVDEYGHIASTAKVDDVKPGPSLRDAVMEVDPKAPARGRHR